MARKLGTSPVYEYTTGKKTRDSFDPRSLSPLGEDSICMVNRLEIPLLIDCFVLFCFCYYMIELLRFFQNISCVLSSEHENQNMATIGTLLD